MGLGPPRSRTRRTRRPRRRPRRARPSTSRSWRRSARRRLSELFAAGLAGRDRAGRGGLPASARPRRAPLRRRAVAAATRAAPAAGRRARRAWSRRRRGGRALARCSRRARRRRWTRCWGRSTPAPRCAYRDATRLGRQALDLWPESERPMERVAVLERRTRHAQPGGRAGRGGARSAKVVVARRDEEAGRALADAERRIAGIYALQGDRERALAARRVAAEAFAASGLPEEAAAERLVAAGCLPQAPASTAWPREFRADRRRGAPGGAHGPACPSDGTARGGDRQRRLVRRRRRDHPARPEPRSPARADAEAARSTSGSAPPRRSPATTAGRVRRSEPRSRCASRASSRTCASAAWPTSCASWATGINRMTVRSADRAR